MTEFTIEEVLQKGIDAHRSGRFQDADRFYSAILKVVPNHSDANHNLGLLAIDIGKPYKSLSYFKTAVESDPKRSQFWISYLKALIALNNVNDAKLVVKQAQFFHATESELQNISILIRKIEPSDPSTPTMELMAKFIEDGNYDEARHDITQLLTEFPNSCLLYNLLGVITKRQDGPKFAKQFYEKAISINPFFAEAYYNLGCAMQDLGEHERAITTYERALDINPKYKNAHLNLVNTLIELDELNSALTACDKAHLIDRQWPAILEIKEKILKLQNDMAGAKKVLLEVQKILIEKNFFQDTHKITKVLSANRNLVAVTEDGNIIKRFTSRDFLKKELELSQRGSSLKFLPEIIDYDIDLKYIVTPKYKKIDICSGKDFSDDLKNALELLESANISHNDLKIFDELHHHQGNLKIIDWETVSTPDETPQKGRIYLDDCVLDAYLFFRSKTLSSYEPVLAFTNNPVSLRGRKADFYVIASYHFSEFMRDYEQTITNILDVCKNHNLDLKKRVYVSLIFQRPHYNEFRNYDAVFGNSEVKKAIDSQSFYSNDYFQNLWDFWLENHAIRYR